MSAGFGNSTHKISSSYTRLLYVPEIQAVYQQILQQLRRHTIMEYVLNLAEVMTFCVGPLSQARGVMEVFQPDKSTTKKRTPCRASTIPRPIFVIYI